MDTRYGRWRQVSERDSQIEKGIHEAQNMTTSTTRTRQGGRKVTELYTNAWQRLLSARRMVLQVRPLPIQEDCHRGSDRLQPDLEGKTGSGNRTSKKEDRTVSLGVPPIECRGILAVGVSPYWTSPARMPKGLRCRREIAAKKSADFCQSSWVGGGKKSEPQKEYFGISSISGGAGV